MTTIGKYRHLSHCSTPEGHFAVLAIDHRTNLLDELNKHAEQPLTDADFTAFKQQVIQALLPDASALLTDPAYGIGTGIATRVIDGQRGLLAPVEVTNYDLHPSLREIHFIPGWSVSKIKKMGGDGVKLLLPFHPEADNAVAKYQIVQRLVDECREEDIPFFLEPIAYSLHHEQHLSNHDLLRVTVEMARVFSAMGVDILKLQFPVDAKQNSDDSYWHYACEQVNAACTVPWAILSGGVSYDVFKKQAHIACQAGASGVIVGRAVWADAVKLRGVELHDFLHTTATERMRELHAICQSASPWFERVTPPASAPDWYENY